MRETLLLTAMCFVLCAFAQSQTVFTEGSWEDIKAKAQKENKLIFVDMYFEGCMPCAEMDRRVFPDTAVGNLLNAHFVSFKTDVYKEEIGAQLSMKYAVSGYPTYLFLTADGHALDIASGFMGVPRFLPLLEEQVVRAAAGKLKQYSGSLAVDYPEFYRKAYAERKRQVPVETVTAFLDTQTDLMQEIPFVVMTFLPTDIRHQEFYLDNATELADRFGRMTVRNRVSSLVPNLASQLGKDNDATGFDQLLKKARSVFLDAEWPRFVPGFHRAYYQHSRDADWYISVLQTEKQVYLDWQDISNALAPVIIDMRERPQVLKHLAGVYHDAISTGSPTAVDLYKAGLIQLYLKQYEQAAAYAKQARQAHQQDYFLKGEDIGALLAAAESKTTDSFEPKRAVIPKPMSMD